MCTNANSQAETFNVDFSTIENTVKAQLEMINNFGGQPEAIYMEKGLFDQMTDNVLAQTGLSKEDVTLKRFMGVPVHRMDDVRNMNHHTYFQGWAIPIQVTVKPDSFPKPAHKEAKEAWVNSNHNIGDLPERLKFEAIKEAEKQPEMLSHERSRFGSDFDITKVRLGQAFDWAQSEQGDKYWRNIDSGNFTPEQVQPAEGLHLNPVTEIAEAPKAETSYSDEDRQAFLDNKTIENLPTALANKALANFDSEFANRACGFDVHNGDARKVSLNYAFDWDETEEGSSFWYNVNEGNWAKALKDA